jgi:hypothetical protein
VELLEDEHPATAITTTSVTPDQPSRHIPVQRDAEARRYKLGRSIGARCTRRSSREI